MKKTNNLLQKLMKLHVEQEEADAAAPEQAPAEPAPQVNKMSSNEKYIIKVLTNSFIFNINNFNKNEQNLILNKIESIKSLINKPITETIDVVKSILSMDKSLKVESKTNILLKKYFKLIEQIADGTESQPDSGADMQLSNKEEPVKDLEDENNISLEEAFPMYSDLMVRSLKHPPADDEIMMLRAVANEFGETDPDKIVSTIKSLLSLDEIGDI